MDSSPRDRTGANLIDYCTQELRDQIDVLHAHRTLFSTIDPCFVRDHALALLQLSSELLVLTAQDSASLLPSDYPRGRAVTVHDAAGRPTSVDADASSA
ncbi:MAG: hypothetical protein ACYC96_15845 [Fimbriimonadaceae bacterium]